MEINLQIDNEKGDKVNLTLTNEGYDNLNFVNLIIEDKEYSLMIDELYQAIFTFKRLRDEADEREEV